jgi:uncharacterized DUF497 family protein
MNIRAIYVGRDHFADESKQRMQAIGMSGNLLLVVVIFVDRSAGGEIMIHIISARKANAYEQSIYTENNSVKRVKISQEIRDLYERRDRSLDNADPDDPVLPPEAWEKYGVIVKYYQPKKTRSRFGWTTTYSPGSSQKAKAISAGLTKFCESRCSKT